MLNRGEVLAQFHFFFGVKPTIPSQDKPFQCGASLVFTGLLKSFNFGTISISLIPCKMMSPKNELVHNSN